MDRREGAPTPRGRERIRIRIGVGMLARGSQAETLRFSPTRRADAPDPAPDRPRTVRFSRDPARRAPARGRWIEPDRDRVDDQLDGADPLARRRRAAPPPCSSGEPSSGGASGASSSPRAPGAARAAGPGRPRSARSPPGRGRHRDTRRRRRPAAGRPPPASCRCRHTSCSRRRRAASSIRSIRGPFDPMSSGGPPGRGPRGRSSQSRAW